MSPDTFRVHPDNPRCFVFRGRPFKIATSAEHYGAVINAAFDARAYLDEMARTGQNGTRVFTFYREEQRPGIPGVAEANTLAPTPEAAVLPWERVAGRGQAADGLGMFDLERWNEAYFRRLKEHVAGCGRRGIVCEIVLFCNPYDQRRLDLFPCGAPSNINGVGADLERPGDFMTLRAPSIVAFQTRFVHKVVGELNAFDNIYYELCNEPNLAGTGDAAGQARQIAAWHAALADAVRQAEAALPRRHLIAANLHLRVPLRELGPLSLGRHDEARLVGLPTIDIINYHYISSMVTVRGTRCIRLAGHDAEAGLIWRFLRQRDDFGKPIVFDETYSGIVHGGPECYAINRAEAWEMLLSGGAGYSNLDWSFTPDDESGSGRAPVGGTPDGDGRRLDGRPLREWLGLLSQFLERTDLATLAPADGVIARTPPEAGIAASVDGAGRYVVYAVDERVYWRMPCPPRALTLEVALPAGTYAVSTFDPQTGATRTLAAVQGGTRAEVAIPSFSEDIALIFEPR